MQPRRHRTGQLSTTPGAYHRNMAHAEAGTAHGYSMDKGDYLRRLKRIEGQVRGLQRLVDEDTYCIDVLTQVAATTKALQGVAVSLLDEHVRHCVVHASEQGADVDARVTEAITAVQRLMRT